MRSVARVGSAGAFLLFSACIYIRECFEFRESGDMQIFSSNSNCFVRHARALPQRERCCIARAVGARLYADSSKHVWNLPPLLQHSVLIRGLWKPLQFIFLYVLLFAYRISLFFFCFLLLCLYVFLFLLVVLFLF